MLILWKGNFCFVFLLLNLNFKVTVFLEILQKKNGSGGDENQRRLSAVSRNLHLTDYQLGGFEIHRSSSLTEVNNQCTLIRAYQIR